LATTVIAANPNAIQWVEPVHEPGPTPNGTRKVSNGTAAPNSAIEKMSPGFSPLHESRVIPNNLVVACRQNDHVSTGLGPCLQRLYNQSLAKGPIFEGGITQYDLRPTLAGRRGQRIPNQLGEFFATGKSPSIEGAVRERRRRLGFINIHVSLQSAEDRRK
jgi:hypothetical protein